MDQPNAPQEIKIKITDEILAGKYSNLMQISHTKDEFILDFFNIVPPQGIATARIITSPGHMKRILKALQENIERYEKNFGPVNEAEPPKGIPFPSI
jgi:hypothetical protein